MTGHRLVLLERYPTGVERWGCEGCEYEFIAVYSMPDDWPFSVGKASVLSLVLNWGDDLVAHGFSNDEQLPDLPPPPEGMFPPLAGDGERARASEEEAGQEAGP